MPTLSGVSIKEQARALGAEVCGIAGVERFAEVPAGFGPSDILPGARSVIVIGKRFPRSVFEAGSNAPYTLVRNRLVDQVDDAAVGLSLYLEECGCRAVPVPSSEPYEFWDEPRRHGRGILSLKHAAERAGLGRIGRNTLLIHPLLGNRLWLGGVIADLSLEPDPVADSLCPPGCRLCLDACPQGALDGVTIDQQRCRTRSSSTSEGGGWLLACNLCRKVCPFSRR